MQSRLFSLKFFLNGHASSSKNDFLLLISKQNRICFPLFLLWFFLLLFVAFCFSIQYQYFPNRGRNFIKGFRTLNPEIKIKSIEKFSELLALHCYPDCMTWPIKHGRERTPQLRVENSITTRKHFSKVHNNLWKGQVITDAFGKTCKNKGRLYFFLYFLPNWPQILSVNTQSIYQTRAACLTTYRSLDWAFKVNMPFIERQRLLFREKMWSK